MGALSLILFLGLNVASQAPVNAGIVLEARVEPDTVSLGNQTELVITAKHPETVRLFFPAAPDLAPFRILGDITGPVATTEGDLVVETWRIPIASLRLGRRKIPPFPVDYESADKETGEVMTPAVSVTIATTLDFNAEVPLRGNAPPLPLYDTNWLLVILLIGTGVVGITAFLTFIAVRYVAGLPKRGPPPPPPRPAHEIAYERLKALLAAQLLAKGQLKEHTFAVSELLREYLGNRYGFDALERTSSELLAEIHKLGPNGLSVYELEAFLQNTDMVKFANITPQFREAEGALENCKAMIEGTRRTDIEVNTMMAADEHQRRLEKPAHPFKRLFAVMVDLLAFSVVSAGLCLVALRTDSSWLFWLDGALLATWLLFRDAYGDGSIGKVMTGLAVTPINDTRSTALEFGQRISRNLTMLLPIAGHTMELVVMAYAADGRRVGDRYADTRVLDRKPDASEYTFLVLSLLGAAAVVAVAYFVPFVWMGA
ncbi:MAG: hypothetical protein ACI9OJ_001934 [Myxococcota bacterium]|jgi:hypothetical protein